MGQIFRKNLWGLCQSWLDKELQKSNKVTNRERCRRRRGSNIYEHRTREKKTVVEPDTIFSLSV